MQNRLQRADLKTNVLSTGVGVVVAIAAMAGPVCADGDAVRGKSAFVRQCAICHTVERDGENRYGPNLFGVVGRKAGAVPGFAYSSAFRKIAAWEWNEDAIGSWMMFPATMIPGTPMAAFQGIAEKDRDDLVAYLATLK